MYVVYPHLCSVFQYWNTLFSSKKVQIFLAIYKKLCYYMCYDIYNCAYFEYYVKIKI